MVCLVLEPSVVSGITNTFYLALHLEVPLICALDLPSVRHHNVGTFGAVRIAKDPLLVGALPHRGIGTSGRNDAEPGGSQKRLSKDENLCDVDFRLLMNNSPHT